MTLAQGFWLAHIPAAIGWIALLAAPVIGPAAIRIARVAAAVLAFGYLILFAAAPDGLRALMADYSLAGIGALFTDPRALLLGWVHYLAFDIWVASWELEEGQRRGISHCAGRAGDLPHDHARTARPAALPRAQSVERSRCGRLNRRRVICLDTAEGSLSFPSYGIANDREAGGVCGSARCDRFRCSPPRRFSLHPLCLLSPFRRTAIPGFVPS